MTSSRIAARVLICFACGSAAGFTTAAFAQAQGAVQSLAENGSILVDGRTFQITPGEGRGGSSAQIDKLGARELGPAAIIFRSGERLYIVDASKPPPGRSPASQRQYLNENNSQPSPVSQPNRIRIDYTPPKNPEHQQLYDMLKQYGVLEILQQIFSPFLLPRELTIRTMTCDMVNAWYSTDDSVPTLHLCYEFIQEILQKAPKEVMQAGISPRDAVVGQFLFWTTHELGHAMFHLFEIPIFGREEDAADQFAAYILLQFGSERAPRLIKGAAYGVKDLMAGYKENPIVEKRLEGFSGVHGLPEQRLYNLLCMAYGADAMVFADLVLDGYLPKKRADHCDYEYQVFRQAWLDQMSQHIDRQRAAAVLDVTWLPPSKSQFLPR